MFPALGAMSSNMPNFNAPDDQAQALAFYISHEASKPLPQKPAPAEMPTGSTHSQLMRPAAATGGALMQTIPIPHVDPLPLPGPVWLFTALLLVVFTLHVAAMNSALGGGIWTLWNYLRGRHSEHPYSRRLANELATMLPVFLAFTVTLGVAALLFVQVLFGNFLYASSILIGVLWLAVIPLVMVAYYGFYYFSYTAEKGKGISGCVLAISVCVLLGIAFIFVNNMTLMESPGALAGDVSRSSERMELESWRPQRDSAVSAYCQRRDCPVLGNSGAAGHAQDEGGRGVRAVDGAALGAGVSRRVRDCSSCSGCGCCWRFRAQSRWCCCVIRWAGRSLGWR